MIESSCTAAAKNSVEASSWTRVGMPSMGASRLKRSQSSAPNSETVVRESGAFSGLMLLGETAALIHRSQAAASWHHINWTPRSSIFVLRSWRRIRSQREVRSTECCHPYNEEHQRWAEDQ